MPQCQVLTTWSNTSYIISILALQITSGCNYQTDR